MRPMVAAPLNFPSNGAWLTARRASCFYPPCGYALAMKIDIELTGESRNLLLRHFKEGTALHDVLKNAACNEVAGIAVYGFQCEVAQAEELLEMARNHCAPAVKDIEHAIFAATAG
jgi:hypothetical protein